MEYEFIHDAITGEARACFSLEHEVIGPWIETEVGHSTDKLTQLLTAIDQVEKGDRIEIMITGHEYSVAINGQDISIQTNASLNGIEILPEMLTSEHINFDENEVAGCGIDDFRQLLLSWARFTKNLNY